MTGIVMTMLHAKRKIEFCFSLLALCPSMKENECLLSKLAQVLFH